MASKIIFYEQNFLYTKQCEIEFYL